MPQRVRDELRRQPGLPGGALEVLVVGAAGHVLVPAPPEQVPVLGGPVAGDVLVDRLRHVQRQRDVTELALDPELQRLQLRDRVDLLPHPQGGPPVDPGPGL